MAIRLKSWATMAAVGTTLVMPDYPDDLAADDFILVLLGKDGSLGTWEEVSTSDFTACPNNRATDSTVLTAGFYRKAAGSDTPRTFKTNTTDDQCSGYVLVLEGVHTTTPFEDTDGADFGTGAAGTWTPPAMTTATANCWNLWYAFGDGGRGMLVPDGLMGLMPPGYCGDPGTAGGGANAMLAWTVQAATGASLTPAVRQMGNDTGQILCFSLKPADATDGAPRASGTPLTMLHPLRGNDTTGPFGGATFDPVSTIVAAGGIDGNSAITYDAIQLKSGSGLGGLNDALGVAASSAESDIRLGGYTIPTVDLSAAGTVISISIAIDGQTRLFDTVRRNGFIFGLRSGTSDFMFWNCGGVNSLPLIDNHHQAVAIEVNGGFEIDEVGTFDASNVTGVLWASNRALGGATTTTIVGELVKLGTARVVGGHAGDPATMETFQDCLALTLAQNIPVVSQSMMPLAIGDGSTKTYYRAVNKVMEPYPAITARNRQMQVSAGYAAALELLLGSSDDIGLDGSIWKGDGSTPFTVHASSVAPAAFTWDGMKVISRVVTLQDIFTALAGGTFTNCGEIAHNGADLSGGNTFSGSYVTLSSATEAGLQALLDNYAGCVFSANPTYGIRIQYTGAGNISLDAPTGLIVDKLRYEATAASSVLTVNAAGGQILSTSVADDETVSVVAPTTEITVTSNVTALIQIFTTGTQTVIDSTTGTSLVYTFTGTPTYDVCVQAAGYLPQRQTVALTAADTTVNFVLVSDPVYNASHGLTYTTDLSYNRSTKMLTLSSRQDGRNHYSALIDAFIAQPALRNTPFPLKPNGPDSIFFLDDAEIIDASSEDNWYGTGIRYLTAAGAVAKEGINFKSVGSVPGGATGEFQQVAGSGTTDARATGAFDQLIWTYGDATHGNFDKRGHFVAKFQVNGYREVRADVLSAYGISALEPLEYVVAMEPTAIAAATGDPAISITVTDHGASPVTWNSKAFSITVEDTGAATGEEILRELNYNLSLDATYQGKDPFNWPEMVLEVGSSYETARGRTEGGTGATLKGVRVIRTGGDPHPDFTRFQADDGSYYEVPVVNSTAVTNLPTDGADRYLHVYNVTTDTLIYGGVPSSSYSDTYTEGADYTDGDLVRVRFAELNGASSFKSFSTFVVATASGWALDASTFLEADPVYAANAVDGSAVTKFSYSAAQNDFNLAIAANFTAAELYAYYCYVLTTLAGIVGAWGSFTALDQANYLNDVSVVDIYLDNETTATQRQTDTARIYKSNGTYPVREPTTSGYGIDVNWQVPVYVQNVGGSSLLASEKVELTSAASDAAAALAQATVARKLLQNRQETDDETGTIKVYDDEDSAVEYTANLYDDDEGAVPWDGSNAIKRRNRLT